MLPQLDPKRIQEMLRRLGIKTEPVKAKEVIIKTEGGDITIENPEVMKTVMKGKIIYQVMTKTEEVFNEEDIKLVMEQSGCKDMEKVKRALRESKGDIVEAIIKLKES